MMFWELIATIFAAFLMAGLVLPIRMFCKKAPKWLVPVAAGVGVLGFQIYHEYTWADNTIAKLPAESVVVAKVPKTSWFRPWSYAKPQVFQFVVLDKAGISTGADGNKSATLYFFERRTATYPLGITVDCNAPDLSFDDAMNAAIIREICS